MNGAGTIVMQQPNLVQRARLVDTDQRDPLTGALITDLVLDPDDLADVSARVGWEAVDELLVELADRLQRRLCPAGVTTHLDLPHLGIRCIGLVDGHPISADVIVALATPLEVGCELVEIRTS